jgi:hypothetical protein
MSVEVRMPRVQEIVEIWSGEAGEPERLVWRSRRFRVTDMPTPLVGPCDWWSPFSEHDVSPGRVPLEISGWRFQASSTPGSRRYADFSARRGLWGTIVGAALSSTAAFVTTTRATPVEDGTSNMIGPSTSSMMARSPRAPV